MILLFENLWEILQQCHQSIQYLYSNQFDTFSKNKKKNKKNKKKLKKNGYLICVITMMVCVFFFFIFFLFFFFFFLFFIYFFFYFFYAGTGQFWFSDISLVSKCNINKLVEVPKSENCSELFGNTSENKLIATECLFKKEKAKKAKKNNFFLKTINFLFFFVFAVIAGQLQITLNHHPLAMTSKSRLVKYCVVKGRQA